LKAALPFFCLGKKHGLHEVWITLILFWLSACGTDDKISENAPLSEIDEGEQVTKSDPNTGTKAKEEKDSNFGEDVDPKASIEGEGKQTKRPDYNASKTREFSIVAYNVENLFDLDGIAKYADYAPVHYGNSQLQRKLEGITETLHRIGDGSGPDVVLLQEIELDRTPEEHLSATELLKQALDAKGLGPYHLAKGRIKNLSLSESSVTLCLTLSKFPIEKIRTHRVTRARAILETHLSIDGRLLVVFNNHWKSGASSAEMEKVRLQNAEVLRGRIDELLNKEPSLDIVVGGDLNSNYNQKTLFKGVMPKTAVNDVLLSHGNESLMQSNTRKLYNLWHELPSKDRGSEVWTGRWGTLMHLLLSNGLYDNSGVQYVADSFKVIVLPEINAAPGTGVPRRWTNDFGGVGVSDHLPVFAKFTTKTERPSVSINHSNTPSTQPLINYTKAIANAEVFGAKTASPENLWKVYRFSGKLVGKNPLTMETAGKRIRVWSFDSKLKRRLFAIKQDASMSGLGYLSRYKGNWQLILEYDDWLDN
tara:strand:- start:93 stop:1694 length:1602 start_codon:yes stop_codon:yes gene_type:complete